MQRLIERWDQLARRLMGIRPVAEGSVLGYALRRYPRRSVTGADGVTVRRGDPVIELHLDSRLILARTRDATPHQRVLAVRRELVAGLRILARKVQTDPSLASARGLWAISLFHRGAAFLGFTVVDLPPSPMRRLSAFYLRLLLSAYHPEGADRLHQREEELVPKELFMSREMLLQRFGDRPGRQPKANPSE